MQHTGRVVPNLLHLVEQRQNRDFVSMDECLAEARKQLAERYPDLDQQVGAGDGALASLVTTFAGRVAWLCAAEATRRAKKSQELL